MRKLLRTGALVATVAVGFVPALHLASSAQASSPTTVVLSFDAGWANQAAAVPILDAKGFKGTFYVNSGNIDQPGFLSWPQLQQFQADGHEIGGNTLNYVDVNTPVAPDTTQNQVCEDRGRLMQHGLNVTSFSYPYGEYYLSPAVLTTISTTCGYNSARDQYGLYDPTCVDNNGCGNPDAGAIPPADPYMIPAARNVDDTTTLAQLEGYVSRAQAHGGGLVPIVFDQICANNCDTYSTSPAMLQAFVNWLSTSGATVKTMNDVIGGTMAASPGTADTTAPTSAIQCGNTTCIPSYVEGTPVPVSLGGTDELNGSGVDAVRYTTDGSNPTITSPVYTAPFNVTYTTTVKYAAWDNAGNVEATNTQLITIPDTTAPTSSILCGGVACSGGWFNAGTHVSLSGADAGSGIKEIRYTTDGSTPTLTSSVYTGPFSVSSSSTVKYFAVDKANIAEAVNSQTVQIDAVAPVSTGTCNATACSTGWYHAAVTVALSGSDAGGSGLAAIHYTLDNTTPTASSPVYTTPLALTVSKWVKFRAIDHAGNAGAVTTDLVQIDTAKPVVTIKPGDHAHVTKAVTVTIKTSDAKSGVAKIGFSIDNHHITTVTKSSLSLTWHTAKLKKGRHLLTAKVFDRAGNVTIKTVTVVVG